MIPRFLQLVDLDNIITINPVAIKHAIEDDEIHQIEYFILHEIRHVFQNLEIEDYHNYQKTIIDKVIIEKWDLERLNYQRALDSLGNENEKYFYQDCEIDAYSFAYAVMKYKYGEIDYLYIPNYNNDLFQKFVIEWIEIFREECL